MEASYKQNPTLSKEEKYQELLAQYKYISQGNEHPISLLANTAAALHEAFGFFWVGFYLAKGEELILGPFQGTVACSRIRYGKGVCGTSWATKTIQLVPDVDQFPGHIACSSASRSEIVLPIFGKNHEVIGVLDIDSDKLNDFDKTDSKYLNEVVTLLQNALQLQSFSL